MEQMVEEEFDDEVPTIWVGTTHKEFANEYNLFKKEKREHQEVTIGNGIGNEESIAINDPDVKPNHCIIHKWPRQPVYINELDYDYENNHLIGFGLYQRIKQAVFTPLELNQQFFIGKQRMMFFFNKEKQLYKLYNYTAQKELPTQDNNQKFTIGNPILFTNILFPL